MAVRRGRSIWWFWLLGGGIWLWGGAAIQAAEGAGSPGTQFPRALESYSSGAGDSLFATLAARVQADPFNLAATVIFFLAILHTFLAPFFLKWAHRVEHAHQRRLAQNGPGAAAPASDGAEEVSFNARMLHFLGEIEAVFGIWIIPLLLAITWTKGWSSAKDYLQHGLNFTEPLFVVVIMAIAASRPILQFAERIMAAFACLGKGTPAAWWLSILTVGPVLGSLITEPAAMTISAMLLSRKFYERQPRPALAYATLGLLFVNVSVGGTLTHFAAPPVLMVAGKWGWGIGHMFTQFGWKALAGIAIANILYFLWFRGELRGLGSPRPPAEPELLEEERQEREPAPYWVTAVHLSFLVWTILNNHYPVLFVGGFLLYIAFTETTRHHQFELHLRPALLVGFFLAGLVVHGGLQGWWIEPVLSRLNAVPLFFGAAALTAFNDNAAITYLASLVPGFGPEFKYAVVAGAVAGGGLTVIANAPNPAGQSILARHFPNGVSPLCLLAGALLPTACMAAVFLLFGRVSR